ncbi:hypothetical protein AHiyo6_00950 [Arthrobacter sp. Hiyo6]|nr:hypothetical protein AHiyo6_00950 [Arthrobacter sp. Hiyo6]
MQKYDWEATAYSGDLGQRMWLHYSFELDGADAKAAQTKAHRQAEQRAVEEGCDPSTIEDLALTLTDCDHADYDEDAMGGSFTCNSCGKYFKGFAD